MDKQIQKLEKLIKKYLNQPRYEIFEKFGAPQKDSQQDIWFFMRPRFGFYRDEIAFIFTDNIVTDIVITEFILWKPIKNIFYCEGHIPEYEVWPIK